MSYLAILGRQPAISLAELISLYGDSTTSISTSVARVNGDVDFARLGGTQKIVRELRSLGSVGLDQALRSIEEELVEHLQENSKSAVGISVYGKRLEDQEIFRAGLSLKKQLKHHGISSRIVPSKNQEINAAQIIHNRMNDQGADIVIVYAGNQTFVGVTKDVQDIEAYAKRDHGRPARSAKVGMLPPKLAQIMINLANPQPGITILDPFCGTGVVLQEAALMGYDIYGTDIEPGLIEMSQTNLDWLAKESGKTLAPRLEAGDARSHQWTKPFGAVVTEGYLGTPQTAMPSADELDKLQADARDLTLTFLHNLRSQIEPGTPVCITLPAWKQKHGFARLEVIDQILSLGYTSLVFLPVTQADLLYMRPDQFVARELVTLRSN